MLRKVTECLMDVYGYEFRGVISHRIKEENDVVLASGPVTILLSGDEFSGFVTMRIIEQERQTVTTILQGREDYAEVVLNALLDFAVNRLGATLSTD